MTTINNPFAKALLRQVEATYNKTDILAGNSTLIPIPKEVFDSNQKAKQFIKLMGKMHKDESLPIEVKLEPTKTQVNGLTYTTIDVIISYDTTKLDIDDFKKKLSLINTEEEPKNGTSNQDLSKG